jgi:hypothetical protein
MKNHLRHMENVSRGPEPAMASQEASQGREDWEEGMKALHTLCQWGQV